MKKMNSLLVKGFQASKCKTQLRLGTSRIKVLRNKKGIQIATAKGEVAEFLRNGQENNARLLVEQVITEQDLIAAYDLLSLYAERIAAQLPVIDSQKTCPSDLKEDISTLLYASLRCAELPDFAQIHPMFVAKYGKEFVSAATDLRPGCGVNGKVIEKLSANCPTGETKLKLMKEIAAEHSVDWDPAPFEREIRADHDDVLPGAKADTSPILFDDFPSVPSQKPTLGTHVSHPENFINSTSGRFVNDKAEPTNSPRPDDYTTGSPGALPRTGPPSRKPPGRDPPPRPEDLTFDDRHPDVDPRSWEKTQSWRKQRRESDSFLSPSPQAQHQIEEARRNSIGVPREKNVQATQTGMDESLPKHHNRRDLHGAGIDDFDDASHRKGSHGREYESGFDGRQSQQFAGKEGSGKGRPQHQDQYAEEDSLRRAPSREGSGKGRPQHQDQYGEEHSLSKAPSREGSGKGRPQHQDQYGEEHSLSKAPSREGSGKGRPQHQDQYAEEDSLRRAPSREGSGKGRPQHQDQYGEEHSLSKAPSREGSGKGRPQHQDQYAEEDNLSRASSREGFRGKPHFQETSVDEGSRGRISSRGKEDKVHPGKKNRKHDYSDEDADHVPEPRRRESTSNTPKYSDEDNYIPEWDNDHFRNSVTTRIPRNAEDEYRDSGISSRRGSLNKRMSVEDTSRKSNNNPSVPKESASSDTPHYDSSEDEYDTRHGGGTRKPKPRYDNSFKTTDTRNVDWSSDSGEEGSRKGGTRRTSRLSSVDEQRRDTGGKRHGREDPAPVKTSKQHPNFDHDDDQVDSDDDHFSSRTTNHDLRYTEKRMSMPGRSVHEKVKYQGNRPNDEYDDSVRRRVTIGPEEIYRRENEDPPRSRYGEKEKQLDSRRQSAPLSKVMQGDAMEGRHSPRDKTDRHRAGYDGDRPPRFSPQVGLQVGQDDDEYSPNTRTAQRDRSDRQRKPDVPVRFDDGKPPPRFMKAVNNQPNVDDEDSRRASLEGFKGKNPPQRFVNSPRGNNDLPTTPRPRSNLQSAKTDPELPRVSGTEHHRKSQSAFAESSSKATTAAPTTPRLQKPYTPEETVSSKQQVGQPQSKPVFRKPPDLDSIITMFGNMGNRRK